VQRATIIYHNPWNDEVPGLHSRRRLVVCAKFCLLLRREIGNHLLYMYIAGAFHGKSVKAKCSLFTEGTEVSLQLDKI
jgi:hypothetical protein